MYKCGGCGLIFEEPKSYSEDMTPGGAFEGGSFIQKYDGCPNCSGGYSEATQCDGCGEYYFGYELEWNDDGYYCENCIDEEES